MSPAGRPDDPSFMIVRSIEHVGSLSPEQLELLDQLGQWPPDEKEILRVYLLDDGDVLVAPVNDRIKPGMRVVGEGSVGVTQTVTVPSGTARTLHWAAELREFVP